MPEGFPKKSRNFSVPKAVPLTARMETTEGNAGQQTMDIQTASHIQESPKVPLLPMAEDENAEEGNSTGRLV